MGGSSNNNSISVQALKEWATLVIAVIACVSGVIFWVQSASDAEFERVQVQIDNLRNDMDQIERDNDKILRVIGRLEGRLNTPRRPR
jgi:cell division protein FtsB